MTFTHVNLEIWATYRDAVMPTPVPEEIVPAYRKAIKNAADEFKKVKSQDRRERLEKLRSEVRDLERSGFVPPAGCYLSTYKVKKPYGTYEYWKLWSKYPVFPTRMNTLQAAYWQSRGKDYMKEGKVKTMHLGKTDSITYNLAVQGLQTRKRIEGLQREIEVLLWSLDDEEEE